MYVLKGLVKVLLWEYVGKDSFVTKYKVACQSQSRLSFLCWNNKLYYHNTP